MKEIQGKIKLGVIEIKSGYELARITSKNTLRVKFSEEWKHICNVSPTSDIISKLSSITEEQAAEFVESDLDWIATDHNGNPELIFKTAKESLISLLKANDVWIKEWCMQPNASFTSEESDLYDKLPDDLLLIKL